MKMSKEAIEKRTASRIANRGTIDQVLLNKRVIDDNGCWIWQGQRHKKPHGDYGYLHIEWNGVHKTHRAHRLAYEVFVGPIPEGLEIDHLCRNTLCMNPEHLEPVTHTENMRRRLDINKSYCVNGHEFSPENTYINTRGRKECRTCKKASRERTSKFYIDKRAGLIGNKMRGRLTSEDVAKIRQLSQEGHTFADLGRMFQVSGNHIGNIVKGKKHKQISVT